MDNAQMGEGEILLALNDSVILKNMDLVFKKLWQLKWNLTTY